MFDVNEAIDDIIYEIDVYNENCYDAICDEVFYKLESGELTELGASLVLEQAYDKYICESYKEPAHIKHMSTKKFRETVVKAAKNKNFNLDSDLESDPEFVNEFKSAVEKLKRSKRFGAINVAVAAALGIGAYKVGSKFGAKKANKKNEKENAEKDKIQAEKDKKQQEEFREVQKGFNSLHNYFNK